MSRLGRAGSERSAAAQPGLSLSRAGGAGDVLLTLASLSGSREPVWAAGAPKGPFEPTWESIRRHYRVPRWFRDGKFGIFLHWGLYAVPGKQSEWYIRHMYGTPEIVKWHAERFGPRYADFYGPPRQGFPDQKFGDDWVARNTELIDKYRPDMLWFDAGLKVKLPAEKPCEHAFALKSSGLRLK